MPIQNPTVINWWVQQSGKRIRIRDMDTSHIRNCILKIKHHPQLWRKAYLPLLEAELEKRNEGLFDGKDKRAQANYGLPFKGHEQDRDSD